MAWAERGWAVEEGVEWAEKGWAVETVRAELGGLRENTRRRVNAGKWVTLQLWQIIKIEQNVVAFIAMACEHHLYPPVS